MTQSANRTRDLPQWTVFYLQIEDGVRSAVKALRDAGINTECSCHHEGYIQCQTLDPTTELDSVYNVMSELRLAEYSVEVSRRVTEGHHYDSLIIRCEEWRTKDEALR